MLGFDPAKSRSRDLVIAAPHPETGVVPMQVNPSVLRSTPAALARVLMDAASA